MVANIYDLDAAELARVEGGNTFVYGVVYTAS